ncbi:MAG: sigma-70 family RNA polymerase sigma factor [Bacilli bacterium]|nr:sigma-70 family RNA polymerase sigma factor [Bacilli bacterium]
MISSKTFTNFIHGDELATQEVYEEFRNLAYFVIATYISNADDCNDVLSNTFLRVLENRQSIENAKNLKQFICTTAKNEAINFMKKEYRSVPTDLIDEMYGSADKSNDVLNLLEPLLTNKEVIVVYYKVIFEMTWEEITRETGIPSSSARLIYKQAKAKLRKELRYVV